MPTIAIHPGRPAPQAASPRNLCVLCVSALDSSSLGLTFNLQLSTFNRVSFLSSHLSLSQRSSKSFTIRTSMAPLPQPLYNPHLQTPLGSAGNKGLITPLESALTRNSPVTPVESALTKRWGVGSSPAFNIQTFRSAFHSSPLFSYPSKLFCTFLHLSKTQPFCFHAIPHSLQKTRGVGGVIDLSSRPAKGVCPFCESRSIGTCGSEGPHLLSQEAALFAPRWEPGSLGCRG